MGSNYLVECNLTVNIVAMRSFIMVWSSFMNKNFQDFWSVLKFQKIWSICISLFWFLRKEKHILNKVHKGNFKKVSVIFGLKSVSNFLKISLILKLWSFCIHIWPNFEWISTIKPLFLKMFFFLFVWYHIFSPIYLV